MNSNQSTGIHCKVICQDQMRRFQFSGTEFSSLQHQVNQVLGLNREFVLKYKDNEGDMITISSTEELSCAIEISQKENGGLFRLSVILTENDKPFPFPTHPGHGWGHHHHRHHPGHEMSPFFPPHSEKPGCELGSPDHHPWKGRRCHGSEGRGYHGNENCKNRFEKRRNKLMYKRDFFQAYLSSLEQNKELSPEEERKKQIFQAKVQRIDSVMAQFFPPTDQPGCNFEKSCPKKDESETEYCPKYKKYDKCHRKFEKKAKKFEKKEHKDEMKKERKEQKFSNLSEEAKAEIKTLKNQINELKPALYAIDKQLKTKKEEARNAFENGHPPGLSFRGDIIKLKQEKRAIKDKIAPLRQRIHQLKSGGSK